MDREESEAASVLKGIVSIASGLGQVTIMEGVETKEQLKLIEFKATISVNQFRWTTHTNFFNQFKNTPLAAKCLKWPSEQIAE